MANLSPVLRELGRPEEAVESAREAVTLAREGGVTMVLPSTLSNLGLALMDLGHRDQAVREAEDGLRVAQEIADRDQEPAMLNNLADIHLRAGERFDALARVEQALRLAEELGDHNETGRALEYRSLLEPDPRTARRLLEQALAAFAAGDFHADVERVRTRLAADSS